MPPLPPSRLPFRPSLVFANGVDIACSGELGERMILPRPLIGPEARLLQL